MYDARAIAHFFLKKLEEAGRAVDNRTLYNLSFYANGWYYALIGDPLIVQPFKASLQGPFLTVDHDVVYNLVNPKDKGALSVLNRVWDVYSRFSDVQLASIVLQEESVRSTPPKEVISNEVILKSFKVKRENGKRKRKSSPSGGSRN
jgi:uncharacterized phage-associated protein